MPALRSIQASRLNDLWVHLRCLWFNSVPFIVRLLQPMPWVFFLGWNWERMHIRVMQRHIVYSDKWKVRWLRRILSCRWNTISLCHRWVWYDLISHGERKMWTLPHLWVLRWDRESLCFWYLRLNSIPSRNRVLWSMRRIHLSGLIRERLHIGHMHWDQVYLVEWKVRWLWPLHSCWWDIEGMCRRWVWNVIISFGKWKVWSMPKLWALGWDRKELHVRCM